MCWSSMFIACVSVCILIEHTQYLWLYLCLCLAGFTQQRIRNGLCYSFFPRCLNYVSNEVLLRNELGYVFHQKVAIKQWEGWKCFVCPASFACFACCLGRTCHNVSFLSELLYLCTTMPDKQVCTSTDPCFSSF